MSLQNKPCGFQSTYFVFNVTENGAQTYGGVAMELLNELSFRVNFRYAASSFFFILFSFSKPEIHYYIHPTSQVYTSASCFACALDKGKRAGRSNAPEALCAKNSPNCFFCLFCDCYAEVTPVLFARCRNDFLRHARKTSVTQDKKKQTPNTPLTMQKILRKSF